MGNACVPAGSKRPAFRVGDRPHRAAVRPARWRAEHRARLVRRPASKPTAHLACSNLRSPAGGHRPPRAGRRGAPPHRAGHAGARRQEPAAGVCRCRPGPRRCPRQRAGIQNAGQTCSAARASVERSAPWTRWWSGSRSACVEGGPGAGRSDLGPLISKRQRSSRTTRPWRDGGLRPLRAGRDRGQPGRRVGARPTLVAAVRGARARQEEIFRPVQVVIASTNEGRRGAHRQRHALRPGGGVRGRATARARCAWRARCAAARCSSTTTAPAAASSCPRRRRRLGPRPREGLRGAVRLLGAEDGGDPARLTASGGHNRRRQVPGGQHALQARPPIVTGGGSGFGGGHRRKFVAEGAKVIVADRDAANAQRGGRGHRRGGADGRRGARRGCASAWSTRRTNASGALDIPSTTPASDTRRAAAQTSWRRRGPHRGIGQHGALHWLRARRCRA